MGARILIVEDEERLAKFMQLELSYEGYEVSVAHDGLSGLMAARAQAPDLIILDWMMPGLT
ncbi:MAG TPA: response regulator, partial [Nodosilinea sp.]|nr:response regulator [Nodosilinea sp.]